MMGDDDPRMFDVTALPHALSLAERFVLPPFTVLDARGGWWQDRKRQWIALGIEPEKGRDAQTFAKGAGADEVSARILGIRGAGGQSVFDPVLAELAYRWFAPAGGLVLDPFAGGSVRGIVAGFLGYRYHGVDLSADQIAENRRQATAILPAGHGSRWLAGDSAKVLAAPYPSHDRPDFVFSCPPYHDLEVYSDDPNDLSRMSWEGFAAAYRTIIAAAVGHLRPNRFAVFVVGEIRAGAAGGYRGLVPETIAAFENAGARYYNELILVQPAGTLPVRAGRQFEASRKLGRCHQTALVFVKGDPKAAAAACGPVVTSTYEYADRAEAVGA